MGVLGILMANNEEDIGPSQYEVRSDNELAIGVIEDYRKNVLVIYTGSFLIQL